MQNVNEEDSDQNNLNDEKKINITVDKKEPNDNRSKKKKKNKRKKNRKNEDKKHSTDKSFVSITNNITKESLNYNLVLNEPESVQDKKIEQESVDISHLDQNNKNKFIRFLPVIFIFVLILGIYLIYIMYHIFPLLFKDLKKTYIDYNLKRGVTEVSIFHFVLINYLVNYILSIIVSPGNIPNTDEWTFNNYKTDHSEDVESYLIEKKKSGERRYCKWCCKFKPDRTHHCRVCRSCILKMDHHCPWIYNCIGWNNHKYFMLSLIYCCITCLFVSFNMLNSVKDAIRNKETPFNEMFLLLFGITLNSLLALIITCFLIFHLWLMMKAMTTIEFCEKQTNYKNKSYSKYYNKGLYGNFKDIFGDSPFLWFLPINNKSGDGINFVRSFDKGDSEATIDEAIPIKSYIK